MTASSVERRRAPAALRRLREHGSSWACTSTSGRASEAELFLEALDALLGLLGDHPELEFVDVGGGFGVPYRDEGKPVDLDTWGRG